jgi:hypothetical protein
VTVAENRVEVYPAMPPPLTAGRYELHLDQEMAADGEGQLGDVAAAVRHLEVTAPRVAMPGTELFSTYPPPNASGPFTTRLPQVALRRRTLPWERNPSPAAATLHPWLALVVVTAEEATFLSGVKAPDAFTPAAARALGVTDDGSRADAIEVTRTAVHQIFPRKDELALLAHVRKVDVHDCELAGNDDDGWVAVLLSNRLPQAGLAYRACVISLEGQFDVLADPAPAAPTDDRPGKATLYADVPAQVLAAASFAATANPVPLAATDQPITTAAGRLGPAAARDAWVQVGGPTAPAVGGRVSFADAAAAVLGRGFVAPRLDLAVLEPLVPRFRFPVLASWEFVCEGSGDFESLMQGLDVGLLGTVPAPVDAVAPAAQAPTVLETGHLEIDHLRRRGTSGRAWYRGPLTPREVARRPATVPFLVADQARRVATDGLEDLSEAAAFEIGRLLALAAPRFVAALRSWARDGFAVRQVSRRLDDLGLGPRPGLGHAAPLVGLDLLAHLATDVDGAAPLGPLVPAVDLGALADLAGAVEPRRLAVGLGLDAGFVADVLADAPTTVALPGVSTAPLVTAADELGRDPAVLAHLGGALDAAVRDLIGEGR